MALQQSVLTKIFRGRLAKRAFRCCPDVLWRRYQNSARKLGLTRPYLILSFDCDTDEDAQASAELDQWLRARRLKASYAVPGQQLAGNADIYQEISLHGAAFINHGALPHTAKRDGEYYSITWYHKMTPAAVADDIRKGHQIIRDVIGGDPQGFRAPHFGYFQSTGQLACQYDTLRALGYRYSTSTVPAFSFTNAPVIDVGGLHEVPVSGTYANPLRILDSWMNIPAGSSQCDDRYARQFRATIDAFLDRDWVGIFNLYVDPAHVHQVQSYYDALQYAVDRGIQSLHYDELLDMLGV